MIIAYNNNNSNDNKISHHHHHNIITSSSPRRVYSDPATPPGKTKETSLLDFSLMSYSPSKLTGCELEAIAGLVRWSAHLNWWFSVAMLVYQSLDFVSCLHSYACWKKYAKNYVMLCPDAMLVFLVCFGKTLTSSFWKRFLPFRPPFWGLADRPLDGLAIVSDIVPDKSIMFSHVCCQISVPFSIPIHWGRGPSYTWISPSLPLGVSFCEFPQVLWQTDIPCSMLACSDKQLGQFPEDEKHCLFRLPIGLPSLYLDWVCSSRLVMTGTVITWMGTSSLADLRSSSIPILAAQVVKLLACWIMKILNEQLLKPSCLILFDGYTCRGLHYSIQWEQSIRGNPYLGAQQCQWQALMAENCRATGHGAWGRSEKWWVLGCAPRLMTINYNCYMYQ